MARMKPKARVSCVICFLAQVPTINRNVTNRGYNESRNYMTPFQPISFCTYFGGPSLVLAQQAATLWWFFTAAAKHLLRSTEFGLVGWLSVQRGGDWRPG